MTDEQKTSALSDRCRRRCAGSRGLVAVAPGWPRWGFCQR